MSRRGAAAAVWFLFLSSTVAFAAGANLIGAYYPGLAVAS